MSQQSWLPKRQADTPALGSDIPGDDDEGGGDGGDEDDCDSDDYAKEASLHQHQYQTYQENASSMFWLFSKRGTTSKERY